MKLYFGNMVTTVTTIMIIALVGFIGYSVWNRNTISYWGCRNLFLLMYGLVICCFAAARDGLDKTIQAADRQYNNFSGLEDGKTGGVSFIIETGEISADTESN